MPRGKHFCLLEGFAWVRGPKMSYLINETESKPWVRGKLTTCSRLSRPISPGALSLVLHPRTPNHVYKSWTVRIWHGVVPKEYGTVFSLKNIVMKTLIFEVCENPHIAWIRKQT